MNALEFVQNIKKYCELRDIKPTVACRESGVGTSFINNIEKRGSMPSVEKVQALANYLGVTTSELLGEEQKFSSLLNDHPVQSTEGNYGLSKQEITLILAYRRADQRAKQMVDLALEPYSPPASTDTAM